MAKAKKYCTGSMLGLVLVACGTPGEPFQGPDQVACDRSGSGDIVGTIRDVGLSSGARTVMLYDEPLDHSDALVVSTTGVDSFGGFEFNDLPVGIYYIDVFETLEGGGATAICNYGFHGDNGSASGSPEAVRVVECETTDVGGIAIRYGPSATADFDRDGFAFADECTDCSRRIRPVQSNAPTVITAPIRICPGVYDSATLIVHGQEDVTIEGPATLRNSRLEFRESTGQLEQLSVSNIPTGTAIQIEESSDISISDVDIEIDCGNAVAADATSRAQLTRLSSVGRGVPVAFTARANFGGPTNRIQNSSFVVPMGAPSCGIENFVFLNDTIISTQEPSGTVFDGFKVFVGSRNEFIGNIEVSNVSTSGVLLSGAGNRHYGLASFKVRNCSIGMTVSSGATNNRMLGMDLSGNGQCLVDNSDPGSNDVGVMCN